MRLARVFQASMTLLFVVVATLPVTAFQSGGGGGARGGSSTGGSTSPGTTGPSRPTPSPGPGTQPGTDRDRRFPSDGQQSPLEIERPIFLSGRVMTTEGGPPPEPATIELVCQGQPRPFGYTDSKGRFSINLSQPNNVMPDASVGFGGTGSGLDTMNQSMPGTRGYNNRGVSERQLMGCELRATLPGYRSDIVSLAGRRLLDSPDIGTILMKRLGKVEGYTVSLTSAEAPKNAKKAYEKALDQIKKQKLADAETNLRTAVGAYDRYAVAWYELGRVLEAQNKGDEARGAFEKAIAADSRYVNPYLHLMQGDAVAQNWEALEKSSNAILKLNPFDYPQAWFYNSVANLQMNKLDVAEKSAREALKLDERHQFPKISHILGIILVQQQQYPEAVDQLKGYLTLVPNARDADAVRKQVVEIERFMGKTDVGQTQGTPAAAPPQD